MIMGIDLSSKSTGIAIFNEKHELIHYDCITASSTDLIKRIEKITKEVQDVVSQYDIKKVVLEEVRPEANGGNLATHKALMYAQAAIILMLHGNFSNIKVEFIYPSEWRKYCKIKQGRGIKRQEQKKLDIQFVKDTYDIEVNDDVADAIGIAYGYILQKQNDACAW